MYVSIHPSSSTYVIQGCEGAGACPSCRRGRGGVQPGQVTSLSQGLSTLMDKLKSPINVTPLTTCLWVMGGSIEIPHRRTENMQTPRMVD